MKEGKRGRPRTRAPPHPRLEHPPLPGRGRPCASPASALRQHGAAAAPHRSSSRGRQRCSAPPSPPLHACAERAGGDPLTPPLTEPLFLYSPPPHLISKKTPKPHPPPPKKSIHLHIVWHPRSVFPPPQHSFLSPFHPLPDRPFCPPLLPHPGCNRMTKIKAGSNLPQLSSFEHS